MAWMFSQMIPADKLSSYGQKVNWSGWFHYRAFFLSLFLLFCGKVLKSQGLKSFLCFTLKVDSYVKLPYRFKVWIFRQKLFVIMKNLQSLPNSKYMQTHFTSSRLLIKVYFQHFHSVWAHQKTPKTNKQKNH